MANAIENLQTFGNGDITTDYEIIGASFTNPNDFGSGIVTQSSAPSGIIPEGGWYVYDENDPKPRKRNKGKFLTVQEIEDNKRIRRQEDEELILLLLKRDFDNEH